MLNMRNLFFFFLTLILLALTLSVYPSDKPVLRIQRSDGGHPAILIDPQERSESLLEIHACTNLSQSNWEVVSPVITGENAGFVWIDTNADQYACRFYRLGQSRAGNDYTSDDSETSAHGTTAGQDDTDGDGLSDVFEIEYGFNPASPPGESEAYIDSDHDGMPDPLEFQFFGDLSQHATNDWDHDGLLNIEEVAIVSRQPDPYPIDSPWIDTPSNAPYLAIGDTDEGFAQLDLGFRFPLFNTMFSNIYAGANGIGSFGGEYGDYYLVDPIPNGTPYAFVAPFWSDLELMNGNVRHFAVNNLAESAHAVTWENLSFYGRDATAFTFQTELRESGCIVFRYAEMEYAGGSAELVIGIQGDSGTDGKQWLYSTHPSEAVTNGLAVCFPAAVQQISLRSYPNTADSDQDGLDDRYEFESFRLNPLDSADATDDWDADGLNSLLEYHHGTSIERADTDGDGFTDGFEVMQGFSPTDPDNPDRTHLADHDQDGMADLWELHYFGSMDISPGGDADGDHVDNIDEYLTGSEPLIIDTDADGLSDASDEAPLIPGPRITITEPLDGAVVASSALLVEGTIDFIGTLDSITVNGVNASVTGEGNGYWSFSAALDSLSEGDQSIAVSAIGHHQDTELKGEARVSISANVRPPVLLPISSSTGTVFSNRFVHFSVQTDDPAAVFINGEEMARDGYINYGWAELQPGTNTVFITSTDTHGRETIESMEIICTAPQDHDEDPPADADRDGVLDLDDYAPGDPTIQGPVSINSIQNGLTIWTAASDEDLQHIRTILLEGIAPVLGGPLDVHVHSENGVWGSDRMDKTHVDSHGSFSLPVKLFPGANTITISNGQHADRCRVTLRLFRPRLDVKLTWTNEDDSWRDADMHNVPVLSTIPLVSHAQVYDNGNPDGWRRYSGNSITFDTQPAHWVEVNAVSTKQELYAGLYTLTFSATPQNGYGWYDKLNPKSVHYDYTVELDDHEVATGSLILEPVITSSEYIGSPWNYWKTYGYYTTETVSFAVHADEFAGGYVVDGKYRDMCPQAMQTGIRSFIPRLLAETEYPYAYQSVQLSRNDGGNTPVYLQALQSAQFDLQATREGGIQSDPLCSALTLSGAEPGDYAVIDTLGVFSALSPGCYQVGIRDNSIMKPDGTCYTTNDIPPIDIHVIDPRLIPDYDRNGMIDHNDRQAASAFEPLRLWINDDDDEGDIAEGDSDVPGQGSLLDNANCDDRKVNGRGDLLDFFPVRLDLHDTLAVLPAGTDVEYRLRQADEAVRFVYTDLSSDRIDEYRTIEGHSYGPDFSQDAFSADTLLVNDSSVQLNAAFLERIAEDSSKGVLLIEGIKASTQPLVLEIWKDGRLILENRLSLSISGVEEMYRWINLRHAVGAAENRPTDISEPRNLPDAGSNGKSFVFVHGYSVHETAARAWNAEMFKRLHQSGSLAMFTAVTWQGNDSQLWGWIPFVGGSTPDYYENVENAFATAPHLAALMPALPGKKVIAGHSLGNMLISSAIKDHGLQVSKYFMLNAAVAMEAYDLTANHTHLLRHPYWQAYSNRLWASSWYQLFPETDYRSKLTWRERFSGIPNALNYFSSTEDTLANANGNIPDIGREQAWVGQEMRKGTILMWIAPGNAEAGWGFNSEYDLLGSDIHGDPVREWLPPNQANLLPDTAIRTNSFFMHFDNEELYTDSGGNFLLAGERDVRNSTIFRRLLADAIPALSNPAGRNSLGSAVSGNRDFMGNEESTGFRRGLNEHGNWPRTEDEWWHSDIKAIAYPYNYKVFEEIIINGDLR